MFLRSKPAAPAVNREPLAMRRDETERYWTLESLYGAESSCGVGYY